MLSFCILQAIKNWSQEGLGTRLTAVADKLKQPVVMRSFFADYIRKPERKIPDHVQPNHVDIVTTEHASLKGVTPVCINNNHNLAIQ